MSACGWIRSRAEARFREASRKHERREQTLSNRSKSRGRSSLAKVTVLRPRGHRIEHQHERDDGLTLVVLVDEVKRGAICLVECEQWFVRDGHEHIFPHEEAAGLQFALRCHRQIRSSASPKRGGVTWPLPRRRARANGDRKQRHGSGQLRDCMQYGATKWA